ncbi:MAG: helix-turn-helix transcriptional regulator [Clostridiales bacterium]|nr:helix-turn-helix transcriptional regulator [Clostridiales bacterium]
MDIALLISKTIKKLRLEKNLTQDDLAYLSGLDKTYISLIERGKRNPTVLSLYAICKALGISLSEFFVIIEETEKAG